MILSCSTLCCTVEAYPRINDCLSQIKKLGFHTVDLAVFENWQNVNPSTLVVAHKSWTAELLEALSNTKIDISSLNCGLSHPLNDPDPAHFEQSVREMKAIIRLARTVHCPTLTLQPGNPMPGTDLADSLAVLETHLKHFASLAHAHPLTLSVEGHQGSILEDPQIALDFMRAVWPAAGFTYDPSHWVMQDIALAETESLLAYTCHVHVRNAASHKMQETMHKGDVDFAWLIQALQHRGYDGAVAIEYFSGFDADFINTQALRDTLIALGVK